MRSHYCGTTNAEPLPNAERSAQAETAMRATSAEPLNFCGKNPQENGKMVEPLSFAGAPETD